MSYWLLILRNSLRDRRRSALTVVSIAVSFFLLALLLALYRSLFYGAGTTPGQAKRLVVHHKIALTQNLPVSYEEKIRQIPGVHAVTSLRWLGGTYKDACDPKNRFARYDEAFAEVDCRTPPPTRSHGRTELARDDYPQSGVLDPIHKICGIHMAD